MTRPSRPIALTAAAAAVVLAVSAILLLRESPVPGTTAADPAAAAASKGDLDPTVSPSDRHAGRAGPVVEVRRRRLIERIWTEPEEPCRGEDTLVHVTLADGAEDAKVFVLGRPGRVASLRFEETGPQRIPVLARDWRDGVQIRRHRVHVRDCDVSALSIDVVRLPDDAVVLRTRSGGDTPLDEIHWDLGDGGSDRTRGEPLEHSYALRAQDGPTSTFVVRAEARGAHGARHSARAAITFVNPLWTASRGAITWLPVRLDPFTPETGEALPVPGGESAKRGVNHYRVPASIGDPGADGAVLEEVVLAGFACRDGHRLEPMRLPPSALSTTRLIRGQWTGIELTVPADVGAERICRAEVRIYGQMTSGRPVAALFGVELATPDDRRLETDPHVLARLRCARRLLDRPRISPADLARLDALGALARCDPGT